MDNELRNNIGDIIKNTAFPAAVAIIDRVSSLTLPDCVSIVTLVYLGLQIAWLIKKWRK